MHRRLSASWSGADGRVLTRTGVPTTHFMVHFRLLLSGASYVYRVMGNPTVPGLSRVGAARTATTSALAYTATGIDMVISERWCPGTYRVSVAATAIGPFSPLRHRAKPFGTAEFTVRP
jgi:hypothetical protein